MIQANQTFVYDRQTTDNMGPPSMQRPTVGPTNAKHCSLDHFVYGQQSIHRPEDHFCCGCHVQTGANIIGLLGLIFSVPPFIGALAAGSFSGAVGAAINAVVCALLLDARATRNGMLYMPFLVLNAITLILFPLIVVVLVVGAITGDDHDLKNTAEFFCLAFAIGAGPVYGLGIWFEWIVYKAYKSLQREP